ncbi:hypothetical protein A5N82_13965 [Christensenella minuta]|uniref:Uncharacterized protein n=1 Tax=Christensenella minuta TaxID=626937 RepID=A0A136Q8D4_9FIRM|nr:hypothetical protein [Christensenella minuta]AYH41589.1 hypothetical protein B1H56_14270 [Christensenella minuta]KXK66844.1 hypothetical protein HMPREF3293_00298 [Christensenella minuta]OAQ37605.1 hypothetical protein A5N82_13965 [Christensenella minuta]
MLGTEVIKLNREMSFDDVEKLISEKWNAEPFGAFAPKKVLFSQVLALPKNPDYQITLSVKKNKLTLSSITFTKSSSLSVGGIPVYGKTNQTLDAVKDRFAVTKEIAEILRDIFADYLA